ncbi:hypothetical protein nbrc107696_17540 [Gordonia spumicola]|uniref:Cupin type-2 domain-containing protein n=1 Tax=Gordonia spumicola TaxID=589161 RepID=A0A7I9V7E5_9ACTN|nr:cupin domain-containing protein [Gordonia spumicola]GEE01308.1 hypothetical protein nbrc107696_17540 [Gordonia spumicola]
MHAYLTDLDAPNDTTGDRPTLRRLHLSDTETVIRIAFRAGQQMREHTAAHPILVLGQTGEIDFTVENQTHRLRPGTAVTVDRMVPHALTAVTDGTVTLVMIHGSRAQGE